MTLEFTRTTQAYERAIEIIPSASQTFSKAAMSTVEGAAPLFVERGDGPFVWDIDGNRYIDYVMGLLPNVLGYRDPDVDQAIRDQLDRGISFSLATELEADVAELLVRLIPCAEMVRFGKNGSDATTAAIRLARAYTGRDKIALCGYHGWHDWYIGTTARHLGVPRAIRDLSVAFPFNDAVAFDRLLRAEPDQFAALILEPAALQMPAPGFLESLRALCDEFGVVLVFDEIVTGFRIDLGGAQAAFGITPDLSAFGKAMGNGMPVSAIVGRRGIMRLMDDIFFSGTFGGEALSLAAAAATVRKLEKMDGPAKLRATGATLTAAVGELLVRHDVANEFRMSGDDWWPALLTTGEGRSTPQVAGSLLKQELIQQGILMGATFNLSLSHCDDDIVTETIERFDRALESVSMALSSNDPAARLNGRPIQPVFQVRKQAPTDD